MPTGKTGLLGDTPERSYKTKLELFNQFAAPELNQVIEALPLQPGALILDAGCGSGFVTTLLRSQGNVSIAWGLDLSRDHLSAAAQRDPVGWVQGDLSNLPFQKATFDLVWCCNTINHLRDPLASLHQLSAGLKPDGALALLQSAFLPEMYFAWDTNLEQAVREACYAYYREKYGLRREDTKAVRNLVGMVQNAGLKVGTVRTSIIERTYPLTELEVRYFLEVVFQGYWGEKIKPYLEPNDWDKLLFFTDPGSAEFCLLRPDFHHLQTLTLVIAHPGD